MKAASLLAAIFLVSPCYSAVVQNVVTVYAPNTPPFNAPYRMFSSTGPYAGSIQLELSSTTTSEFTFQALTLGEGWGLLLVGQGLDFDAAYVNAHPFFVSNYTPQTATLTLPVGQTAYIAFWDHTGPPISDSAKDSDRFGWALVRNVGGNLVVTDSAVADGGGIKVGTLQQIPEPGVLWGVAGGILLCALRRRRVTH